MTNLAVGGVQTRQFLLPCPSRGMTEIRAHIHAVMEFLLPCPSRGMTGTDRVSCDDYHISTPMPLAGHDAGSGWTGTCMMRFLLPCPSRGMTHHQYKHPTKPGISTPMPLAGHDVIPISLIHFVGFLLPCPSRGMTRKRLPSAPW